MQPSVAPGTDAGPTDARHAPPNSPPPARGVHPTTRDARRNRPLTSIRPQILGTDAIHMQGHQPLAEGQFSGAIARIEKQESDGSPYKSAAGAPVARRRSPVPPMQGANKRTTRRALTSRTHASTPAFPNMTWPSPFILCTCAKSEKRSGGSTRVALRPTDKHSRDEGTPPALEELPRLGGPPSK